MKNNSADSSKKSRILSALMVVCLLVMAFSLYKLISISMDYREGEKEYDILQSYTTERKEISASETADEASDEDSNGASEGTAGKAKKASKEKSEKKVVRDSEPCPISVDFEQLKEINPDLVCWLYLPVLDLSYPVVQGKDNDWYLHRTFTGTENFAGTLFIDAEVKHPLEDPHTIIYGHSMKNQTMFGKLKLLLQNDLYSQAPYFWIITAEGAVKYQMANIAYTEAGSSIYTIFENADDTYTDYLQGMYAGSTIKNDQLPELSSECSLVTLSTCAAAEGTGRFVVQGVAIRD